ncbi:MAG: SDR family NAD(P)-dependent oxidoreductase [Bacteroidetes bacterium]|nr:SDR family NAD(P)-dependent oxidoreductase [Bacteroidota bacterium]
MEYALVTGGSQGIGRAIARELAGRGFGIFLAALDNSFLDETAFEIASTFKVPVIKFPIDLTKEGAALAIKNKILEEGISLKILVNNAGFGRGDFFENIALDTYQVMMSLNNRVMVELCHQLIPLLKMNKSAYILNIGSMESFLPMPVKAVYTATKHFVLAFSLAIGTELSGTGVSISVLCPGPVVTNEDGLRRIKNNGARARLVVMMPEEVAPVAVKGLLAGKRIIVPGNINKLILFVNNILPVSLKMKLLKKIGFSFLPAESLDDKRFKKQG